MVYKKYFSYVWFNLGNCPANTEHLYNSYTTSTQRLRGYLILIPPETPFILFQFYNVNLANSTPILFIISYEWHI